MTRAQLALSALALLVTGGGCGRQQPMGQVEGVLTQNGKPLHGVQVQFMPDPESGTTGPRSVALTDERGWFSLQTEDGTPGAVAGTHVVCLVDAAARINRPSPKGAPPKGTLPAVAGPRFSIDYSSAARTPFQKVIVTEGSQVINLDVKAIRR